MAQRYWAARTAASLVGLGGLAHALDSQSRMTSVRYPLASAPQVSTALPKDENCPDPSCRHKQDALSSLLAASPSKKPSAKAPAAAGAAEKEPEEEFELPSVESVGNAAWSILHGVAAHYPKEPTPEEAAAAAGMVQGLATLYPCKMCAPQFQEYVREHPPKVATRDEFLVWTCELHNEVNEKLGKDKFRCEASLLLKRWL